MAQIVLGLATSHTPMLALSPELWGSYAERDAQNPELAFPPDGLVMPYTEALAGVAPEVRAKYRGAEAYPAQAAACQRALDELSAALRVTNPDVTIVVTDDQDEWFFEDNMPALAVYWGETAPLRPRWMPAGVRDQAVAEAITRGYGDVPMDVPVASAFASFCSSAPSTARSSSSSTTKWLSPPDATTATRAGSLHSRTAAAMASPVANARRGVGWFGG